MGPPRPIWGPRNKAPRPIWGPEAHMGPYTGLGGPLWSLVLGQIWARYWPCYGRGGLYIGPHTGLTVAHAINEYKWAHMGPDISPLPRALRQQPQLVLWVLFKGAASWAILKCTRHSAMKALIASSLVSVRRRTRWCGTVAYLWYFACITATIRPESCQSALVGLDLSIL
jgi:hypothetical protein